MAQIDTELMNSLTNGVFAETACSSDTSSVYTLGKCYWAGTTPTCQVVIAHSPVYGKVLFLDQEIQSAESDEAIYHEHLVHPAMAAAAHIPNKNILIVGGGEGATCREVLKWNTVDHIDWVDIDGPLVDLCRRYLSWADDSVYNDPRVAYYPLDIRHFLRTNHTQYDVIILDLPDPDVDALRTSDQFMLYGREFWNAVCEHMRPGGVIVSHVGPIAPGGDPAVRRAGLHWIQELSRSSGMGSGNAYHVNIPSFQGEWGFWMSQTPHNGSWPENLTVMNSHTQLYAFTWPTYWDSPFVGNTFE
jgi:spermidine synthase